MVDIHSATAEIRRGKKKRRKKEKPSGKNIMSASATRSGHNKQLQYKPQASNVATSNDRIEMTKDFDRGPKWP